MPITISEQEIAPYLERFRLKTHQIKRPSASDPQWESVPDRTLAAAQFGWDNAKEWDDRHQAHVGSIIARKAEEEAARRQQQREQDAKRQADADAKILTPAYQAFKNAGGRDEDWEAAKSQILADARVNAAREAAVAAADAMQPKPGAPFRF